MYQITESGFIQMVRFFLPMAMPGSSWMSKIKTKNVFTFAPYIKCSYQVKMKYDQMNKNLNVSYARPRW